jgi:hypothetical protein
MNLNLCRNKWMEETQLLGRTLLADGILKAKKCRGASQSLTCSKMSPHLS